MNQSIITVTETSPYRWTVDLSSDRQVHLQPGMPLLMADGWRRGDHLAIGDELLDCDDNSWQDRYPIKQAKRLVDVRHWPKDELRKYIPSSKSIERLQQGARWVRWVRPARSVTSGTLYGAEEGARVVDGGTALELYRNDDYPCCRVYYIRWGDDDPRHYCREWKNR